MHEINASQAALFTELIYNEVVTSDPSRWVDYEDVISTFSTLATNGLLTAALSDFPPLARSIVESELDKRNRELGTLMNGLSWDERARVDNGQPIAGATDSEGKPCFNVWLDRDEKPTTYNTRDEAIAFANDAHDKGHAIFVDFW